MAQITSVTSESLQAQLRRLLPSQQGFGEDLQASNVITPIIDLTSTAEGSNIPQILQTALAFGSQTIFDVVNTSTTIANTPGFFRVTGNIFVNGSAGFPSEIGLQMTDGTTTKDVYMIALGAGSTFTNSVIGNIDLVFFLRAGDELIAVSPANFYNFAGSIRQIADVNGNLINPSGFIPT